MSKIIIILIVVVVAYVLGKNLFRAKVKTIIKDSVAKQTDGVTLIAQEKPTLKNAAAFEEGVRQLENLGFISEGTYSVQEMPGVIIAGFSNTKESLFASAYEHPAGLHWVEIKGEYTDGTVIYASNAPNGDQFDVLEGYIKIVDKTANAEDLFERMWEEGKDMPFKPVQQGDFKTNFEESYVKFMVKFKAKQVSQAEVTKFIDKS